MRARKEYLLLSIVLFSSLIGVIPLTLAMPDPGSGTSQTKSATYRHDLDAGW
ncbi:MAG: hypothetical protein ACFFDF_04545 [Candidatus Odinarchaeota archaeon]